MDQLKSRATLIHDFYEQSTILGAINNILGDKFLKWEKLNYWVM